VNKKSNHSINIFAIDIDINIDIACINGSQNKHTIEPKNVATVCQKNLFQFMFLFFNYY